MRNRFGEMLKSLLAEKELSVNQFARIIKVSPSAVSAWCRGVNQATADNIILVAEYFEVSTDFILGLTDN